MDRQTEIPYSKYHQFSEKGRSCMIFTPLSFNITYHNLVQKQLKVDKRFNQTWVKLGRSIIVLTPQLCGYGNSEKVKTVPPTHWSLSGWCIEMHSKGENTVFTMQKVQKVTYGILSNHYFFLDKQHLQQKFKKKFNALLFALFYNPRSFPK